MTDALSRRKNIALVAHDNCKADLVEWAEYNRNALADHHLIATGTTGNILEHELGLPVERLQSGPLGGDMQIGARISDGDIDAMVFFWDPLEAQPHDPDVKALLRIAVVWNIPVACNRASADFMVSSPLMATSYERRVPDFAKHNNRLAPAAAPVAAPGDGAPTTAPVAAAPVGPAPAEPPSGEATPGKATPVAAAPGDGAPTTVAAHAAAAPVDPPRVAGIA